MNDFRPLTADELYDEFRRAEDFLASGQPTHAARIIAPVVDAAPGHRAALELLARAYFDSAQLGRAESTLRSLVQLVPDDGWARHALARTLERAGRADEAAGHRRGARRRGLRAAVTLQKCPLLEPGSPLGTFHLVESAA